MASADSPTIAGGLEPTLNQSRVDDWSDPQKPHLKPLKNLRKYQYGDHRIYISGRNTDCRYDIVYVWPFKKKKDDKPANRAFQDRILNALTRQKTRFPDALG